MLGTRDPDATLARTEPDRFGGPPFRAWNEQVPDAKLGTFSEAAAHGEVVINATAGDGSMDALGLAGAEHLDGKILMDVANPLDFSTQPVTLFAANDDSLAERIQRAFPGARVVKTLNTMTASVMVNPGGLAGGDHHVFVSGDDPGARAEVAGFLREWFGWKNVIDLGDLTSARGAEMILPLWLRIMTGRGSPMFNFKVVTEENAAG